MHMLFYGADERSRLLTAIQGVSCATMQITGLSPTRFDLPGKADPVYIATQQWTLKLWDGEDPPELGRSWAIKPKFVVNGNRSCAELAIVHHLRDQGWLGVWVCAYGSRELRTEWFPAPAVKTITQTGVPLWAVEIFDRLRAANGGKLDGFFDVFAWRHPGEVRFDEAKTSGDSPRYHLGCDERLHAPTMVERLTASWSSVTRSIPGRSLCQPHDQWYEAV